MEKGLFQDRLCTFCVLLTLLAAACALLDTSGVLSLVGFGIGLGVFFGNLLVA